MIPGLRDLKILLDGKIESADIDGSLGAENIKQTNGLIKISVRDLAILEGTVLGGFPMPGGLPKLGDADIEIPVENGIAKLKNQQIKSSELHLTADGSITLAKPLNVSKLNLKVRFKLSEEVLKKDPILKALLSNLKKAKGSDGYYTFKIDGPMRKPKAKPQKQ